MYYQLFQLFILFLDTKRSDVLHTFNLVKNEKANNRDNTRYYNLFSYITVSLLPQVK